MILPDLESSSFWANVAVVVFTLLGASAGGFVLYFSSMLSAAKDAELELFQNESRVAIAKADARSAETTEKAESFRLDIASANERAVTANRIAEGERLARVKIEERLANRTLTDAQVAVMVDKLKVFTGQEFEITAYWDHKESLAIANRTYSTLLLAGWKFIKPENGSFLMGGVSGVFVYPHPDADELTKKAAASLVSGLSHEGIAAEIKWQNAINNPKHNKIHINVGTKP